MRVYVIRHGESETNREGLWTGWLDVPLTERGRAEAEQVGHLLSRVKFDKVYVSDLLRARTTAGIALPACEYTVTPALREINVGDIAGKPLGSVKDSDRALLNREGYGIFGGESRAEFGNRVEELMKLLEGQECENVALFSHAGVLRKMLDTVLGTEVPRRNMLCKNCAVAILEYNGNAWALHSWINLY